MTSTLTAERQRVPRSFRPRLAPTLAALIAVVILLGLGTWQVQRLHWKNRLIQTIADRSTAAPLDLSKLSLDDPAAIDWQHVEVAGEFLPESRKPQLYTVENRGGVLGGRLLAAFVTNDGAAWLVDRGYLPENRPAPTLPTGIVHLDAVLRDRSIERQTLFLPDNDPATGQWFWLDLTALDMLFGQQFQTVALQLLPGSPGATPGAAPPRIDLPNNHLGYAITWYGLAAGLLAVYLGFSFKRTDPPS